MESKAETLKLAQQQYDRWKKKCCEHWSLEEERKESGWSLLRFEEESGWIPDAKPNGAKNARSWSMTPERWLSLGNNDSWGFGHAGCWVEIHPHGWSWTHLKTGLRKEGDWNVAFKELIKETHTNALNEILNRGDHQSKTVVEAMQWWEDQNQNASKLGEILKEWDWSVYQEALKRGDSVWQYMLDTKPEVQNEWLKDELRDELIASSECKRTQDRGFFQLKSLNDNYEIQEAWTKEGLKVFIIPKLEHHNDLPWMILEKREDSWFLQKGYEIQDALGYFRERHQKPWISKNTALDQKPTVNWLEKLSLRRTRESVLNHQKIENSAVEIVKKKFGI